MSYLPPKNTPSLIAFSIVCLCVLSLAVGIFGQLVRGADALKDNNPDKKGVITEIKHSFANRLAVITLEGMITDGPDDEVFGQPGSAPVAKKLLHAVLEDASIKGVLLRINSPGGTVGMSQELYEAVLDVREEMPVVVSMGDLAASGGYYTASAADWIVANKGTLTASIGVIIHSMNMEELFRNKLGIQPVTVKSGKFKDMLSPYRRATSDDMAMIQSIINESYNQFINDVIVGRTMRYKGDSEKQTRVAEALRSIADGRVVVGTEAAKVYLVDSVGTKDDAIDKLKELAAKRFKSSPERFEIDETFGQPDFWDMFSSSSSASTKLGSFAKAAGFLPKTHTAGEGLFDKPASMRYANQPLWLLESLN